jgi:hypothetical protein
MRTTDAGDMLTFLDGQAAAQFVASAEDLERRLALLDCGRDPDGRFRVNELYGAGSRSALRIPARKRSRP